MNGQADNVTKVQRKDEILKVLFEKGHVEVKSLAEAFNVSEATARRDLRNMADEGLVELVYGGATMPRRGNYSLRVRKTRNVEAKRVIARLAAPFIQNRDAVFIDSGTTCGCLTPHLLSRQELSIITNSNLIAAEIGERTDFNVLQVGGKFRYERMDSVGPFAQMIMEQLSGYKAIIGADGLGLDIGLTSTDIETAHLYQTAIRHASETILLADHSKFSAPALYKISGIELVNRCVTDRPPSPEWQALLEKYGIDLVCPEAAREAAGE